MEVQEIKSPEDCKSYCSELLYKVEAGDISISAGIQSLDEYTKLIARRTAETIAEEVRDSITEAQSGELVDYMQNLVKKYQNPFNDE